MTDPQYLECFACGEEVEDDDELVVMSVGWENDGEFEAPFHRDCVETQ